MSEDKPVTRLIEATRQIQSRLKNFFDSPLDANATPLEICEAVVDAIERRVQPLGRGRRVFPYDRVLVRVARASADRPALQAAFAELPARVRRRLEEVQAEIPDALDVKSVFLKKAPDTWPDTQLFSIDLEKDAVTTAPLAVERRTCLLMTIVKGAAAQDTYRFTSPEIAIGRSEETSDARGRLRRNDVAFLDAPDGITETVGRAHARFERDQKTGDYLVFDEGSSNGTSIVRQGATIAVPSRDPRGVRVQSGDEVRLGRAVIRVEIETA